MPRVSCEGEAEYALAETVGFRLRFWFGEGLLQARMMWSVLAKRLAVDWG